MRNSEYCRGNGKITTKSNYDQNVWDRCKDWDVSIYTFIVIVVLVTADNSLGFIINKNLLKSEMIVF